MISCALCGGSITNSILLIIGICSQVKVSWIHTLIVTTVTNYHSIWNFTFPHTVSNSMSKVRFSIKPTPAISVWRFISSPFPTVINVYWTNYMFHKVIHTAIIT